MLHDLDGDERWRVPTIGSTVTFSDDGAWVIALARDTRSITVRVFATATGELHAEKVIPRDRYVEAFETFHCFRGRCEIDDLSLALPDLEVRTVPADIARYACGDRFTLEGGVLAYALRDDVRDRYVLWRELGGRGLAVVSSRFVLVPKYRSCIVHDLVRDTTTEFPTASIIGWAHASTDGRRVLISSSHPELYELDWERDPVGDLDPLTTAWADHPRPPIVDALLPEIRNYRTGLEPLARHHPELELALANEQRPSTGAAATRRLLQDPEIAAMPAAWAQLARMSLQLEQLDEAADAAAEALGRAGDDPALHALLDRIERARAAPRVPPIAPRMQWRAHGAKAFPIAARGSEIATLGTDENREEWLRLWRVTGELVEQHLVGPARDSCGNHIGLTDHLLLCTTDEGVVGFRRGETTPPIPVVSEREPWKRFDFGSDGLVVGVIAMTTLCWTTLASRIAEVEIEADPYYVRVFGPDALLLYAAHEYRKAEPRLERVARDGSRAVVPIRAFELCVDGDVAYAGGESAIYRWTTGLEPLPPLEGHRAPIYALAARGELVAAIDRAGSLRWWRGERAVATGVADDVTTLAIADDETTFALHRDGTVTVWSAP